MPVFKDERRTAGAILAEMLLRKDAGEDVTELQAEFQKQSEKQLGLPNDTFRCDWSGDTK